MPPNPPQTLSVKRKRHDPAPETLVVEGLAKPKKQKKQKNNDAYAWRLVTNTTAASNVNPPPPSPAPVDRPKFHLSYASGKEGRRVLVQQRAANGLAAVSNAVDGRTQETLQHAPITEEPPRPRKRPGAGAAPVARAKATTTNKPSTKAPSEDEVKQFEKFSQEVEQDEVAKSKSPTSPKFKPKVPALRYHERHPESAAALDPDAMDVDVDDYVYDTYIREVIIPDAQGKLPEPQGTVGVIVLKDEDEDWWNGDDESDREFDTDDEDENAEDYYANDYPEDEVDSDDEFDRNLYQSKFRHGSDDEEYDLDDDDEDEDAGARSDENEDDEHFRRIAPLHPPPGYWGRAGEL
ncbi:hypothetical protein P280DRAFT_485194 [Massarina eburnea CBS 473.64]|uniref:Transcription factor Iwr1 domain-containing protein n=1 Tax=Massarina eburnea CBS 473.64 TaxID=1395130 RepID=A0A6A6RHS3_9PLEO|nr:hypothetical protein P280DRAFT_485194 [Massarina eburnea CBS 473.64]